jgi:hypothetical protein
MLLGVTRRRCGTGTLVEAAAPLAATGHGGQKSTGAGSGSIGAPDSST